MPLLPIEQLIAPYLVVLGLIVGSFINLAADRIPRGESVVSPRSHCRSCGRVLNLVDLIPVAGYLIRRGRCATCECRIGITSPVVEAIAGLLIAGSILWLGLWRGAAVGIIALTVYGLGVVAVSVRPNYGWIERVPACGPLDEDSSPAT